MVYKQCELLIIIIIIIIIICMHFANFMCHTRYDYYRVLRCNVQWNMYAVVCCLVLLRVPCNNLSSLSSTVLLFVILCVYYKF